MKIFAVCTFSCGCTNIQEDKTGEARCMHGARKDTF